MIMRHLISLLVLWTGAWSSSVSRTKRDDVCRHDAEYTYNGICCLNCPAGSFAKEMCSKPYERGVCQQCDFDTYTEHDNGLSMCLKCTQCRQDQEIVEQCTTTRNTQCQCKKGSYCRPDQACEVCKTCRKCKEDEEVAENCTAHSNTVCRKRGSSSSSADTSIGIIISVVVFIMIIIIVVGCLLCSRTSAGCKKAVASRWPRGMLKMCIENGSDLVEVKQNTVNGALEAGAQFQPFLCQTQLVGEDMIEDEEDKGLGPSLPDTTASSQTSLPIYALTSECFQCLSLPQQLNTLDDEKHRRLIPLNGDDSLRRSFDLFAEIDVNFHNRFFRLLELSDNAIRTAEVSCSSHEDRVYELLKVWMEKEGMKADFNSLTEALLILNQRMSAENIITKAVASGYFRYEEE